ncbi:MAG TPA: cytochrome c biogenesis protein ResB [Alphaproteobacteria bacterium]|nr:cytochrome c biogenesis protein ResB [Alphaproteobacteria bacterium]
MTRAFSRHFQNVLTALARPQIFFWLLIWLMVLLVTGTVAEKYIGLYQSQKLFFGSFVIWFEGFVPAPGGYATLAAIFVNLLCKLITERWTKQKLGTLVTHCAALLLLFGGFLTATYSSEGYMAIDEGASSNYVSDYHRHELAISSGDQDVVFPQAQLKTGQVLKGSLPFTVTIENFFDNSTLTQRPEMISDGSVHGMLMAVDMKPVDVAPEEEKNQPGLIFRVDGAGKDVDGRYAIFQDMPIEQRIKADGKTYTVTLRGERRPLPFEVKLIKFTREFYPGTEQPRSYQSEVVVQDGKLEWHSLISMNNPLRYKGYTIYQSSFIEHDRNSTSVLAVVKNIGALFPYIASIAICIGLLIHLFIRLPALTKTKAGAKKK